MENQTENSEHRPSQQDIHLPLKYHTLTGCIGCLGGLFIHLVISSLYQWGTINIYVTSYYKTTQDPSITLEGNAVIFPAMMLSIGFTMRLGRFLAKTVGVIKTLYLSNILCAASVFISSFMDSFGGTHPSTQGLSPSTALSLGSQLASPSWSPSSSATSSSQAARCMSTASSLSALDSALSSSATFPTTTLTPTLYSRLLATTARK